MKSGPVGAVDILRLGPKNIKLSRPLFNGYLSSRQIVEQYTNDLFRLITSGKLNVKVHKVYTLEEVAQAHKDLESRLTMGKAIIRL